MAGLFRPAAAKPEKVSAEPAGPLPKLTFGGLRDTDESDFSKKNWTTGWSPEHADLELIEARCRLKAEGARWAAARRRALAAGEDFRLEIEPQDRDIIEKAKLLEECFLWMNHPSGPSPEDLTLFDNVAGCFETLATAMALVQKVLPQADANRELMEKSLDLLAEAQSALRASITLIDGPNDTDQYQVFSWLRYMASQQQIFIQRFMRADDPADPTEYNTLSTRIRQAESTLQTAKQAEKQQQSRFQKIRYHLKSITAGRGTDHDWRTIATNVDELVSQGVPPSNRELRELLMPVVDDMPELAENPPGLQLVLREIDRYLAVRQQETDDEETVTPSADVRQAAQLLKGRSMALIGGDRRPNSQRALERAFDLEELVWIEAKEHQSLDTFDPHIARDDVAVVVLAIRWSSHSFGDVRLFCEKYGKPLVRLPAGYNPNQVASHIVSQCSARLASDTVKN